MHTPTLLTLGLMLTLLGCSTPQPAPTPTPPAPAPTAMAKPKSPVPAWVRQDRYTLASTRPTLEQRQPLYQLINVQIAPALHATVGEALRHVLQHSGYSSVPMTLPWRGCSTAPCLPCITTSGRFHYWMP